MANLTEVEARQPTANVVHPGIMGKNSELSVIAKNSSWIIDTGASDHMTRDSGNLNFPKPSSQLVIYTANGSPSPYYRRRVCNPDQIPHPRYSSRCSVPSIQPPFG